jgi:hypothetical protein
MCAKREERGCPYVFDETTFYDLFRHRTHGERAVLLSKPFLGGSSSSGYRYLAGLSGAGYFDVILATNTDSLLEISLDNAGLRQRRDYVCVIKCRDRDIRITPLIRRRRRNVCV